MKAGNIYRAWSKVSVKIVSHSGTEYWRDAIPFCSFLHLAPVREKNYRVNGGGNLFLLGNAGLGVHCGTFCTVCRGHILNMCGAPLTRQFVLAQSFWQLDFKLRTAGSDPVANVFWPACETMIDRLRRHLLSCCCV